MKKKLSQQAKKYMNIPMIIQRIESQGYLDKIHSLLTEIKSNENEFTLQELQKIQEQNLSCNENFNLEEEFLNNTSIFEQNITLILQIMIKEIWDKEETLKFIEEKQNNNNNVKKSSLQQQQQHQLNQKQPQFQKNYSLKNLNANKQQYSSSARANTQENHLSTRGDMELSFQQQDENNSCKEDENLENKNVQLSQRNVLQNKTQNSLNIVQQQSQQQQQQQKAPPTNIQSQPFKNIEEVSQNRPTPSFRKSSSQHDQENISPNQLQPNNKNINNNINTNINTLKSQFQQQQQTLQQQSKKKLIGFGNVPLPKSYFTQSIQNNNNNVNQINMNQNNINHLSNQDSPNQKKNQQSRPRVQSTHNFLSKSHSEQGYGKLFNNNLQNSIQQQNSKQFANMY